MNQKSCAWVLSLLLCISMLLTACGGPSNPSGSSAPPAPPADSPQPGTSTATTSGGSADPLASYDPVDATQDGSSLVNRIESRNGLHTLEHAENIGLGSRSYQLVSMDD